MTAWTGLVAAVRQGIFWELQKVQGSWKKTLRLSEIMGTLPIFTAEPEPVGRVGGEESHCFQSSSFTRSALNLQSSLLSEMGFSPDA